MGGEEKGIPKHIPPSPHFLARAQRGLPTKRTIPGVEKVICVSSAKGGVGKSTVAVNISLALARMGKRTGILDTDVFGPSIPRLLDLSSHGGGGGGGRGPRLSDRGRLLPLTNYGVKSMSIGFLTGSDDEAPVVWRGLMVMKALQQLLHEVEWGGLDVLVLDLPPGTGDTQLTVVQQVVLDGSVPLMGDGERGLTGGLGAVVVSTPQDIALIDAVKGINMFKKVDVPVRLSLLLFTRQVSYLHDDRYWEWSRI